MPWLVLVSAFTCDGPAPASAEDAAFSDAPVDVASVEPAPEELNPVFWPRGGIAPRDVVAPVAFVSTDPTETARLREQAAAAVAPLFRFVTTSAANAVDEFDATIRAAREAFLGEATAIFGPTPFDAKTFLHGAFEEFRLRWIEAHPDVFPPPAELARAWALERDDGPLLQPWREALRAILTEQRISAAAEADSPEDGAGWCRVVAADAADEPLDATFSTRDVAVLAVRQLWTIEQAREYLSQRVDLAHPAAALAGRLLRANLYPETDITARERAERARDVTAVPHEYPAGTVIVRQGEPIGPREFAALADLRAVLALMQLHRDTAGRVASAAPPDPATPEAILARTQPTVPPGRPWIATGPVLAIAALSGASLAVAVALALRRRGARRGGRLVPVVPREEPESTIVRALREEAVQRLYAHRQALLDEQDKSTEQISVLESRVAQLQPRIQDRIRHYEERIKELETMLAAPRGRSRGLASSADANSGRR